MKRNYTEYNRVFNRVDKIINVLKQHIYLDSVDLDGFLCKKSDYKTGEELPAVDSTWGEYVPLSRWGGMNDTHTWFYKKIVVPENFKGRETELYVATDREGLSILNPQFMVYIDGHLEQAMDTNHTSVPFPDEGEHEVYLYGYIGLHDGLVEFFPKLRIIDTLCEKPYYMLLVPHDILRITDPDDKTYIDICLLLNEAVNILDLRVFGSEDYYKSIVAAIEFLDENIYKKQSSDINTICIGQTHIDVAWLWTFAQTREKAQRSFATVVNLMKRYPGYKFMSSTPQLYKYIKEDAPTLYEEIKDLVKQGRWEVEGAMWVEADCNLTGAESLIRQVLYGKRFFKKEFDKDSRILWLPDVFGYSAAMPQILKKCGVDYFVTSKISWNDTNKLPYDTFNWKGIDGSEIFTQFISGQKKELGKKPRNYVVYGADINVAHIAGTWERYQQKDLSNEALLSYGHSDGGGGPTKEMLEHQKYLKNGLFGIPAAKTDFLGCYLDRQYQKSLEKPHLLPEWTGELYLELHRGTYTSMAKNKRFNRKSEFLYHNSELMSSLVLANNIGTYPQDELYNGWENIMLLQFHDVIPGSSIKAVYDDSDVIYSDIFATGNKTLGNASDAIIHNIKTDGGFTVFNYNSFDFSGDVLYDGKYYTVESIPANGYKTISDLCDQSSVIVGERQLENDYFRLCFDENMNITSLFDKRASRQVLKTGGIANVLTVYEDYPYAWDAWDLTTYTMQKGYDVLDVTDVHPFEEGTRGGFVITRKFLNSTIVQKVILYSALDRIDFETEIDWNEQHMHLKTAFPVDVNTDRASYDIQFGNVERPTHRNTSWDAAKFEVCGHKFCDLSDYGYGVSLMNDCKYGYDVHDGVMRLSLLKSPTNPNEVADIGHHTFIYSIYPHEGDFKKAGTIKRAYELNNQPKVIKMGKCEGVLPDAYSLVNCDKDNIVIETVKKAEDGDALIIRLYDSFNMRTKTSLKFGFNVKKATICTMMEEDVTVLKTDNNAVEVDVNPFEIVTIKVER